VEIPKELLEIGKRLREQDNRCTADPIFQVRGKRRIYGIDPDYGEDNYVWINTDDCEEMEPPADEDNPPKWARKVYFTLVDEVLMVALTEEGCKEHLRLNGHNYKGYDGVRIYADSLRRCPEMIALREFLISLPEPN
jgi:hypothetical protein